MQTFIDAAIQRHEQGGKLRIHFRDGSTLIGTVSVVEADTYRVTYGKTSSYFPSGAVLHITPVVTNKSMVM